MKQLIKHLLVVSMSAYAFFFVPNISQSYALEVGLGAKIGYSGSLDAYNPSMILAFDNVFFSSGISTNIFVDLRVSNNFSLVPAVNFTFNKFHDFDATKTDEWGVQIPGEIRMQFHTIDVELLAKFSSKIWYVAIGPALNYNTKPTMTFTYSGGKDNLNSYYDATGKFGLSVVFDFGIHFPLGYYENHVISLGARSSVNPLSFKYISESMGSKSQVAEIFSIGLLLGYAYYFV